MKCRKNYLKQSFYGRKPTLCCFKRIWSEGHVLKKTQVATAFNAKHSKNFILIISISRTETTTSVSYSPFLIPKRSLANHCLWALSKGRSSLSLWSSIHAPLSDPLTSSIVAHVSIVAFLRETSTHLSTLLLVVPPHRLRCSITRKRVKGAVWITRRWCRISSATPSSPVCYQMLSAAYCGASTLSLGHHSDLTE